MNKIAGTFTWVSNMLHKNSSSWSLVFLFAFLLLIIQICGGYFGDLFQVPMHPQWLIFHNTASDPALLETTPYYAFQAPIRYLIVILSFFLDNPPVALIFMLALRIALLALIYRIIFLTTQSHPLTLLAFIIVSWSHFSGVGEANGVSFYLTKTLTFAEMRLDHRAVSLLISLSMILLYLKGTDVVKLAFLFSIGLFCHPAYVLNAWILIFGAGCIAMLFSQNKARASGKLLIAVIIAVSGIFLFKLQAWNAGSSGSLVELGASDWLAWRTGFMPNLYLKNFLTLPLYFLSQVMLAVMGILGFRFLARSKNTPVLSLPLVQMTITAFLAYAATLIIESSPDGLIPVQLVNSILDINIRRVSTFVPLFVVPPFVLWLNSRIVSDKTHIASDKNSLKVFLMFAVLTWAAAEVAIGPLRMFKAPSLVADIIFWSIVCAIVFLPKLKGYMGRVAGSKDMSSLVYCVMILFVFALKFGFFPPKLLWGDLNRYLQYKPNMLLMTDIYSPDRQDALEVAEFLKTLHKEQPEAIVLTDPVIDSLILHHAGIPFYVHYDIEAQAGGIYNQDYSRLIFYRLQNLGISWKKLITMSYVEQNELIESEFKNLDADDIAKVTKSEESVEYVLTSAEQNLDLVSLFSNNSYRVFKIDKKKE